MLSAPLASASASAGVQDAVISSGCRELAAFVTVPVENVQGHMPDDYVFSTFSGNAAGLLQSLRAAGGATGGPR